MSVPSEVYGLVERFDSNREEYRSGRFNETQVRVDFIDPLMGLLGWDVHNRQGRPEAYRDVIHEDRVKVGGGTKAPDYGFYAGGQRRFFLEAKKPSVDIAGDLAPAVQLRRYAWSARLPLSILTDFEEFAVYDCRFEPDKGDSASTARLEFFTYDRYAEPEVWERIYSVFSREAVLGGSLEKYAEANRRRRGTETVDAAFLREIEGWRGALARNLAARNRGLNSRQLNYAVQMTIDRIIFLRMAEDRGIEDYGRLMALLNGKDVYGRLCEIFRQADERYNSGLFHFRHERGREEEPDDLTPSLEMDDEVLQGIIRGLYYPESPYEFSVLPVDVLGQVYEQFLGKVVRLSDDGHEAVIEEKPEVRKAGGVYYTPTYIVDYIVERTVGKLLEGKRPGPRGAVSRLRIVDPACGSGSFLIGAYQYLLDWHRDRYVEDGPEEWPKQLYEGSGGQWLLTIDEKKRILLNNIYGVDIDPQAVEVTKLSLLLKVLEGESEASLTTQLRMFQERVLPDLDSNIKTGNSLIGPDFYEVEQMMLLDEEEHYRINVFDWKSAFPQVFEDDSPGFDAVIGNPPYIRIQALKEFAPVEVEHYKEAYRAAGKGNYDIYVVFVERGLELLNRNGRLSYILPHKFFNAKYGAPVRELISAGKHLSEVVHFGDEQVFAGATTYTALTFLDKAGSEKAEFVKVKDLTLWRATGEADEGVVPAANVTVDDWNFVAGEGAELFRRMHQMPVKLRDVATRMYQGSITSADTVYLFKEFQPRNGDRTVEVFSKELSKWVTIETRLLKPVIRSGSIHRYSAKPTALVLFPYEVEDCSARLLSPVEMQSSYPLTWDYLIRNKNLLESREKGKFKDEQWYRFGRSQNLGMWEQPKVMVPYMVTELAAYLDQDDNYYFINVTTGGYGVTLNESSGSLTFLCGLLNSRLLDFYLKQVSTNFHGGYFAANKQYIEQLPIRTIDFSDAEEVALHERMVGLVERMLALHERLAEAKIERERTVIGHQISATDRQIDRLVYELYGLTEEEIAIVEGNR
ncbi:MAG: Eco57I restriction-modification methylase domain-containing protein [Actinomycetota bacterium]|nr:Eco57I restriction-modification methylase domain-containing protein [Actinomycetota bacterium]